MSGNKKDYSPLLEARAKKSASKEKIAIEAIQDFVAKGEPVTVKALMEVTGLSRAMFYNNKEVAEQLEKAREKQKNMNFTLARKSVLNKAVEKDNELLRQIIKKKEVEIDKLKRENEILKKQIIEMT